MGDIDYQVDIYPAVDKQGFDVHSRGEGMGWRFDEAIAYSWGLGIANDNIATLQAQIATLTLELAAAEAANTLLTRFVNGLVSGSALWAKTWQHIQPNDNEHEILWDSHCRFVAYGKEGANELEAARTALAAAPSATGDAEPYAAETPDDFDMMNIRLTDADLARIIQEGEDRLMAAQIEMDSAVMNLKRLHFAEDYKRRAADETPTAAATGDASGVA